MAEVKTYYGTEPSDSSPGTMWLRTDGTKAQRDLSGVWIEKGSWTLEDDGLLSKEGGAVTGPVTGNHGHAPTDSPAFTTIITLDGEEVPDKPWVTEQMTNMQTDLQNFITEALSGGESGISVGNNMAFGYGTLAHGAAVPLPKYSDDTRATLGQIVIMGAALVDTHAITPSRAGDNMLGYKCKIDAATLVVTAQILMSYQDWVATDAQYWIICVR